MSGPAVVAGTWMGTPDGGRRPVDAHRPLVGLAAAAAELEARVVYVVDVYTPPADEPEGWAVKLTGGETAVDAWRWQVRSDEGVSCTVIALRRDEGRVSGPWQALDAGELLAAFGAFERLVGVPWGSSVGLTAEHLILSTHPRKKGGRLLDDAPVTPEPCEGSWLEQPFASWRRELTGGEQAGRYVHAFDANAQYLAAWGGAELGHGTPTHRTAPKFDPSCAGVWRIKDADKLHHPFPLLPAPWCEGRDWYTTPTVVRLLEVCDGFAAPLVEEAWVWPAKSRFLRAAGERIRDARAAALAELERAGRATAAVAESHLAETWISRQITAQVVLEAVKDLYRVQTGRFGWAGRDPGSGWARPDWGHIIRAQARCNLHRRLAGLSGAPFAIATDGLLFVSDEPDGAEFARRIGLPLGGGLGQYRHDASCFAGELDELATAAPGVLFRQIAAAGA